MRPDGGCGSCRSRSTSCCEGCGAASSPPPSANAGREKDSPLAVREAAARQMRVDRRQDEAQRRGGWDRAGGRPAAGGTCQEHAAAPRADGLGRCRRLALSPTQRRKGEEERDRRGCVPGGGRMGHYSARLVRPHTDRGRESRGCIHAHRPFAISFFLAFSSQHCNRRLRLPQAGVQAQVVSADGPPLHVRIRMATGRHHLIALSRKERPPFPMPGGRPEDRRGH